MTKLHRAKDFPAVFIASVCRFIMRHHFFCLSNGACFRPKQISLILCAARKKLKSRWPRFRHHNSSVAHKSLVWDEKRTFCYISIYGIFIKLSNVSDDTLSWQIFQSSIFQPKKNCINFRLIYLSPRLKLVTRRFFTICCNLLYPLQWQFETNSSLSTFQIKNFKR